MGGHSLLQGIFLTQESNPGIEPRSPALQADSLLSELPGKPYVIIHLSKPVECTTQTVGPDVNHGLQLVIVCHCWFSVAMLVHDANDRGN